jgi:hypothetical protein
MFRMRGRHVLASRICSVLPVPAWQLQLGRCTHELHGLPQRQFMHEYNRDSLCSRHIQRPGPGELHSVPSRSHHDGFESNLVRSLSGRFVLQFEHGSRLPGWNGVRAWLCWLHDLRQRHVCEWQRLHEVSRRLQLRDTGCRTGRVHGQHLLDWRFGDRVLRLSRGHDGERRQDGLQPLCGELQLHWRRGLRLPGRHVE